MHDAEIARLRRNLGRVLRELREEQELSALAVSRHVGQPLRVVQGWEDGTGEPTFEDLVLTCRLLGVRLSEVAARVQRAEV
jgi:DNA-binding transcriptional regulator YiaG